MRECRDGSRQKNESLASYEPSSPVLRATQAGLPLKAPLSVSSRPVPILTHRGILREIHSGNSTMTPVRRPLRHRSVLYTPLLRQIVLGSRYQCRLVSV